MSSSENTTIPRYRFKTGTTSPKGAVQEEDALDKDAIGRDGTPEPSPDIYYGSLRTPVRASPAITPHPSPRASLSHIQLQPLLAGVDVELEDYGLMELRDGFFDATFYRPVKRDHGLMSRRASESLPRSMQALPANSLLDSLLAQLGAFKEVIRLSLTSRSGIKLLKSFLGFFIAYLLCLIPATSMWLGPYAYMVVISALMNHPGRSIGSQIDGVILTISGSVLGLLWATLALFVATSTTAARTGYGGVVTTFLVLFIAPVSWLRCMYNRFYQGILCAGISVFHTLLADIHVGYGWKRFANFIVPWCVGQVICLLVCIIVFPAAGSRPIAVVLHQCLTTLKADVDVPRPASVTLSRRLALEFVQLSDAVRDFRLDFTFSPLSPGELLVLRNAIQSVIRAALVIRSETPHFQLEAAQDDLPITIQIDSPVSERMDSPSSYETSIVGLVGQVLRTSTRALIDAEKQAIERIDAVVMDLAGHRRWIGPPFDVSNDIHEVLKSLQTAMFEYDDAEKSLVDKEVLPRFAQSPSLIEVFTFVHPIRRAAEPIKDLLQKTIELQQRTRKWKVHLPSYPVSKALTRSNAQVRHDRGGITAGTYFRTKDQLAKTMDELQSRTWRPLRQNDSATGGRLGYSLSNSQSKGTSRSGVEDKPHDPQNSIRYKVWKFVHRLQGFESRFATKVTILCALVAIPAWLQNSQAWWNDNDGWWTLIAIWIMMHPRTGGNSNDLAIRLFCGLLGSVWGGLAYGAGNGNPYVMAVFAAIFMLPMLYRFTQSDHPRSGIIGCVAFVIVSLREYEVQGQPSVTYVAWTRGLAVAIGVLLAVGVNWVLWPFVARHELRESIATMLLHSAILYRSVVARYIYYQEDHEPVEEDIKRSELLEGRLREGFVRIRQLMELTKHELRLRAPFDPLPYSALIQECEAFFERLIDVRQSSLFFHPHMMAAGEQNNQALVALRRDAVAAILMNLYIIAERYDLVARHHDILPPRQMLGADSWTEWS